MPYKDPAKQREYNNAWTRRRQARIREWLDAYKLEQGCCDCGYNENVDALQFDHVRGDKVANVPTLIARGMNRVMQEIKKCELRCANCHAIATAARRRGESSQTA